MMIKEALRNIRSERNGVVYPGEAGRFKDFEEEYLEVRQKEGRVFDDDLVRKLPWLPDGHPLKIEWLYRADTLDRFSRYLVKRKGVSSLLDLGCGNGWFINKLSALIHDTELVGLDVNRIELEQAARLFPGNNKTFAYGDIFHDIFQPGSFDIITLNSTIQYFPDAGMLIERLLALLKENGEIHILDSPLYKTNEEKDAAFKRSELYFSKINSKGMTGHYHHHTFDFLKSYRYKVLYKPDRLKNRLFTLIGGKRSPFHWIRIRRMTSR